MDEITTILDSTRPVSDIISDLKEKSVDVPEWSKSLKDYDPSRHKIVTDKFSRKDKIKSDGRVEPASRIHLGLEKLLVNVLRNSLSLFPSDVSTIIRKKMKNASR